MRHRRPLSFVLVLLILAAAALGLPASGDFRALAQDAEPTSAAEADAALAAGFTYQGILESDGQPATGSFDFQFALFTAVSGGVQRGSTVTADNVAVSSGLFAVRLNPGVAFGNEQLYIQIAVRPGTSTGAFTPLAPRQLLAAVPQARYAVSAGSATSAAVAELANQALTLKIPWSVTADTTSSVIDIDNTNGGAARFNAGGLSPTLVVLARGGGVPLAVSSSLTATLPSVLVNHDGPAGYAGAFEQSNTSNIEGAIFARTRGPGYAARFSLEGTGVGVGMFVQDFSNNAGSYAAVMQGDVAITPSSSLDNPGNLEVAGTLSKGGGAFRIDHPLDPANKYLQHSFVESPDMMNIYNGNVTLDAAGEATVTLPDWFEALNRDVRYQLTPIGAPGPNLHIAQGVQGNAFRIAGGTPGLQVSWQVTGIRQDPWANAHRIQVEVPKSGEAIGTYLHPDVYGQPASMGLTAVRGAGGMTAPVQTLPVQAAGGRP